MQTVRLDISNDIFDKVMFLLQNLPKNKVKLSIEENHNSKEPKNSFNPRDYFGVANSTQQEIDTFLEQSKNEWNNAIYEQ